MSHLQAKMPLAVAAANGDEQKENTLNDIQLFNFNNNEVRVIEKDSEPWFAAPDICRIIEIGNPSQALSRLDNDERTLISNEGRDVNYVSESGLYALVLGSRKPEAKLFKRWITHEVLPSIRKHGGYLTPAKIEEVLTNPDTIIQLATNLKAEQEKAKALAAQIEVVKPKVVFADAVATSKTSILVGELAKLLKQNGINIGANRFFDWLRDNKYLIRRKGSDWNMPTQKSMEMGLFEVKETAITHSDGHVTLSKTPKVTGVGQQYFLNLFLNGKAQVA